MKSRTTTLSSLAMPDCVSMIPSVVSTVNSGASVVAPVNFVTITAEITAKMRSTTRAYGATFCALPIQGCLLLISSQLEWSGSYSKSSSMRLPQSWTSHHEPWYGIRAQTTKNPRINMTKRPPPPATHRIQLPPSSQSAGDVPAKTLTAVVFEMCAPSVNMTW